jgi:oligopeptide/dipeptide ABC transporter ATP-binding protein
MGLVGESGCGKSTAGRAILRLIRPTAGEVRFKGENLLAMDSGGERRMRRQMQMIFQDPFGSLNPRLTVERIVEEPLMTHKVGNNRERREQVADILRIVGLLPEHMKRFPHEFSGGQRQRIMIARALVLQPELIICDEPVSALDVSVQAQIINLMVRLQRQFRFSYIIISHDLSVIRYISHKVAVMYLGQIVEMAPSATLYTSPRHPYTLALLSAVPVPNPRYKRQRIILSGDVPSPINPPAGCRFHPRCPKRMDICERTPPVMHEVGRHHVVACHLHTDGPEWRPAPPGTTTQSAGQSTRSAADN